MGKQHIFFDLDGTLTDSMPGITRAVQYALRRYGIQVDDLNVLKPFVGPPLPESFKDRLALVYENGLRHRHPQYTADVALFSAKVAEPVHGYDDRVDIGQDLLSCLSQHHTPPDPFKELHAQFGLKLPYLKGDGRLSII